MKKNKKTAILLSSLFLSVAPISAIVSCNSGNVNKKEDNSGNINKTKSFANPFISAPKNDKKDLNKNSDKKNEDKDVKIAKEGENSSFDKFWGIERLSDLKIGESEPIGLNDRIKTGHPKTEGLNPYDLWNWVPTNNPTGELSKLENKEKRLDYSSADAIKPEVEFIYGRVDGEINRATVPLKDYTHGEKLKPSQSSFAQFHSMPGYVRKNGDNDVGFLPTLSDSKSAGFLSWQYMSSGSNWKSGPIQSVSAPSAALINNAHRMGVPIMGQVMRYPWQLEDSKKHESVILNPGSKKDFPIARGLVEYALYIGFDGYFFDWERTTGASGTEITNFLSAYNSYAKLGYFKDEDGVTHYLDNSNNTPSYIKEARKKYKYKWKELMSSQYRFDGGGSPLIRSGDISLTEQGTRNSSLSGLHQYYQNSKSSGHDRSPWHELVYASNWPEDGQESMYKIYQKYYKAGLDNMNDFGKAPSNMSYWIWNYNGAFNPKMDREIYSSFAGDPRYFDTVDKNSQKGGFSVSNMIQEKTTIIGRKPWSTTFDLGSGKEMHFYGGKNINDSVVSSSENGWLNMTMQSYLPTYQFISDFYDEKNKLISFKDYLNDSSKKLEYPVETRLNNLSSDTWFGGTSLDFKGSLDPGNKMVNKLFASNILLKEGDKFTMIVKKDDSHEYPNLAIWTNDNDVPIEYYKNDGTEQNLKKQKIGFKWSPGTDPSTNNPISKVDLSKYLKVDKEKSWNVDRKLSEVSNSRVEKMGNGWEKLTFDLSSFKNKSLMDFGLSIKNSSKTKKLNLKGLSLGYMNFTPKDYKAPNVSFGDMTLYKKWVKNVSSIKLRVKFNVDIQESDKTVHNNGKYVRYYMTFYNDENWNNTSLAWVGANPESYLNMIPLGTKKQNIKVYAIGNDYSILNMQKYSIKL